MSENNGNGKSTVSFGLTSWSDLGRKEQKQRKPFDVKDRIPFAKLKQGKNIFRIVTEPYKVYKTRFNGKWLNTAYPGVDREQCPALKAGLQPKKKVLVGVIDRSDNQLKLLELGTLVCGQLKVIQDDVEYGDLKGLDVNITMNKNEAPSNYYSTMPRPPAPLSPADLALLESKREMLEDSLVRLTTPPSPESLLKKMESFGYTGGKIEVQEDDDSPVNTPSEDTSSSDDDYSFTRPSAGQA